MKRCTCCGKEYPDDATVCAVDGQPLQPVPPVSAVPPLAQYYPSRKRLKSVAPLRAGIILGILYAIGGFVALPFFFLALILDRKAGSPGATGAAFGFALAIFLPIIYGIIGFLAGVIGAALYNLIASWTGGFEFEVADASP